MNKKDLLEEKRLELIKSINEYSKFAKELALEGMKTDFEELQDRVKIIENTWNNWIITNKIIFKQDTSSTKPKAFNHVEGISYPNPEYLKSTLSAPEKITQYQCVLCKTKGDFHAFRGASEDGSYLKCFMCGSRSVIKFNAENTESVINSDKLESEQGRKQ